MANDEADDFDNADDRGTGAVAGTIISKDFFVCPYIEYSRDDFFYWVSGRWDVSAKEGLSKPYVNRYVPLSVVDWVVEEGIS